MSGRHAQKGMVARLVAAGRREEILRRREAPEQLRLVGRPQSLSELLRTNIHYNHFPTSPCREAKSYIRTPKEKFTICG